MGSCAGNVIPKGPLLIQGPQRQNVKSNMPIIVHNTDFLAIKLVLLLFTFCLCGPCNRGSEFSETTKHTRILKFAMHSGEKCFPFCTSYIMNLVV